MVEWKRVFKEVIEQEIEKKGPSSDFYEYKDDLMVSRATYGATVVQGRVFQLVVRLAHFIHIHIIYCPLYIGGHTPSSCVCARARALSLFIYLRSLHLFAPLSPITLVDAHSFLVSTVSILY